MSFESDFRAHLTHSAITTIVDDRIRPMVQRRSDGAQYITYHIVFGEPQVSLDGFTSNLTKYLVQVDCWALTHRQMMELAEAVRNRLKTNAATIKFIITAYPTLSDFEEETERYRRAIEVSCWHKE